MKTDSKPSYPEGFERLYRRAFLDFRSRSLWNNRALAHPTAKDALVVHARCALRAISPHGSWLKNSSRHAVPLTKIQIGVLRLLASHRDPESYVAGASALNRHAPRYSRDIIFHDRQESVAIAAMTHTKAMFARLHERPC